MVMCSEPMIFAPFSGNLPLYSARVAIRPGISCSARRISLRPHSASERSATLKAGRAEEFFDSGFVAVAVIVVAWVKRKTAEKNWKSVGRSRIDRAAGRRDEKARR